MSDNQKITIKLGLLNAISDNNDASQRELSAVLSASVGLVNALIKDLAKRGFLRIEPISERRLRYELTQEGLDERGRLAALYAARSLNFYRQARSDYCTIFRHMLENGYMTVLFIGASDLVEIAMYSAKDAGIQVVGLFDENPAHKFLYHLHVINTIDTARCDAAFVLTALHHTQRMFDKIRLNFKDRVVLAPEFLCLRDSLPR